MGLNHMNGRVQDAVTGRFLSPDPYVPDPGNTQSYNRYTYVNNNPLSYVDPTGFDECASGGTGGGDASGGGDAGSGGSDDGPDDPDKPDSVRGRMKDAPNCGGSPSPPPAPYCGDDCTRTVCGDCTPIPTPPPIPIPGMPPQLTYLNPNSGTGGGGGGGATPQGNPNKLCNATQAVSFIQAHQADAATVAQQLGVPTQNVLGLSGIESRWGTSNAAMSANNFFGLHGGANAPFANGSWTTGGGVQMSAFPSYLASAQSFAAQYGPTVSGISDPTAFAQALVRAGFNPATAPAGNPNFVADTASTINTTAVKMTCP